MRATLKDCLTGDPEIDALIIALFEASERERKASSLRSGTPEATNIVGDQS